MYYNHMKKKSKEEEEDVGLKKGWNESTSTIQRKGNCAGAQGKASAHPGKSLASKRTENGCQITGFY